jgi:hypothetical protein
MSLLEKASLIVTPNAYKTSKLYSVVPNTTLGDMDVVRGTTKTRTNSTGVIENVAINVPSIDYTNGSCPSILVEPQRTNLWTGSEDLNSLNLKVNVTVSSNTTTSPDGYINADKLQETSANGNHFIYGSKFSVTSGTAYTMSFFAKQGERRYLVFQGDAQAGLLGNSSVYDLQTGTVYFNANTTNTITSYGNGWYRITVTTTATGTSTAYPFFAINQSASNSFQSYAGTTGNGFFLYGFQAELGSYATSYIPTVASTVTRNADVISKTGISSLIGQTEGTVFVEVDIKNTLANRIPIVISSANPGTSTSEGYFYINPSGNLVFEFYTAGIAQCFISAGAVQVGVQKLAFVYKNNDFAFYRNGVQVGVDTGGTVVSGLDRLFLGCFTNNLLQLNDRINSAQIYKTRLTNDELVQLTTL